MILPIDNSIIKTPGQKHPPSLPGWCRPILSPEHGVYVVLLISFLIGAAAAQAWTLNTTLALVCAFCGFQAEHPLVLQIKQRRNLKPRFLVWGGLYGLISLSITIYLALQTPILWWIYLGAIAAFLVDAISVLQREQKSVFNEFITFAAVCLSTPLAYIATTGTLSIESVGLWILNALFFSSTIFTVKLRKPKNNVLIPGLLYHAIATIVIAGLWSIIELISVDTSLLKSVPAFAFSIALLKYAFVLWQKDWYCNTKIQFVAVLETTAALVFGIVVSVSLLPVHLPIH